MTCPALPCPALPCPFCSTTYPTVTVKITITMNGVMEMVMEMATAKWISLVTAVPLDGPTDPQSLTKEVVVAVAVGQG